MREPALHWEEAIGSDAAGTAPVALLIVVSLVLLIFSMLLCASSKATAKPTLKRRSAPSQAGAYRSGRTVSDQHPTLPVPTNTVPNNPVTVPPRTSPPPPRAPPPPSAATSGLYASGVLAPRDTSLVAIEELLHEVCNGLDGSIRPAAYLEESSIRRGAGAVIADVRVEHAVDETVLFFSDRNSKKRQSKLYENIYLRDSMPVIVQAPDAYMHQTRSCQVMMPAAIFVHRIRTLPEEIATFKTAQEKEQELISIWLQLTKLLRTFHGRGWFVRQVAMDNVVFARLGGADGWSLLEYGLASKKGKAAEKHTIDRRSAPPEVALEMLEATDETIKLYPSYDIWRLGVLVYEVLSGEPYWPQRMSDTEVLKALADPQQVLPHEERPVPTETVHNVLKQLLQRDPELRITAVDLIHRLETDLATAVVRTLNSPQTTTGTAPGGTKFPQEDSIILPGA